MFDHVMRIPEIYRNPFDPDDSHYVNLAVASNARLITSHDGDLLNLMDESRPEGRDFRRRFPDLQIRLRINSWNCFVADNLDADHELSNESQNSSELTLVFDRSSRLSR
jgi:predicted nucleic acid-binding protein